MVCRCQRGRRVLGKKAWQGFWRPPLIWVGTRQPTLLSAFHLLHCQRLLSQALLIVGKSDFAAINLGGNSPTHFALTCCIVTASYLLSQAPTSPVFHLPCWLPMMASNNKKYSCISFVHIHKIRSYLVIQDSLSIYHHLLSSSHVHVLEDLYIFLFCSVLLWTAAVSVGLSR